MREVLFPLFWEAERYTTRLQLEYSKRGNEGGAYNKELQEGGEDVGTKKGGPKSIAALQEEGDPQEKSHLERATG